MISKEEFLRRFGNDLIEGTAAIFVGAGMSIPAAIVRVAHEQLRLNQGPGTKRCKRHQGASDGTSLAEVIRSIVNIRHNAADPTSLPTA